MHPDIADEREALEQLADALSLPLDDDTAADVLAFAEELADAMDGMAERATPREGEASPPDDEYNALLDCYGEPRSTGASGLLDGLSVAVKDNIAVRDLAMTCGSRGLSYVPSFDAAVVERLLDEGARIVGKTNMDAYALGPAGQWSEFGRVINPLDPDRVPGGSSSGSGVAVATGTVDVALGTDTGGSVRSPAACCGIVGIKPTHGLVPRYGFVGNAPSTDTIGPLARDAGTAARALQAMAGHDRRDPTSSRVDPGRLSDLDAEDDPTVGLVETALDLVSADVEAALRETADALRADGTTVRPVDLDFGEIDHAYSLVTMPEFAALLRQGFAIRGEGTGYDAEWSAALAGAAFNDHVAERVLPAALLDEATDGAAYLAGRRERLAFVRRVDALLEDADVLLAPTLRTLPPEYGAVRSAEEGLTYSLTKPFSLFTGPAVAVPGPERDGIPVSAQVVAPEFEDRRALACARRIEAAVAG